MEAATRQDMGVFIISPTDKGGALYRPPQKLADACAPLRLAQIGHTAPVFGLFECKFPPEDSRESP
jgi:predicted aldo/keto reductase-like oxidoreductase